MTQSALIKKNVLVIGLGMSGRSAVEFLQAHGATVHGVDRDAQLLDHHPDIQLLKQTELTVQLDQLCTDLSPFDFIVLSPGVPPTHHLVQKAQAAGLPLLGEIELGCRLAHNPMLGITGTNGKTTVTLLVEHVLKSCGQSVRALGNVGVPFTKELLHLSPTETIVLELSSYQLETLYQRRLEAGLLLNITPDHLDRYGTMDAYAAAKCGMERCLKPGASLYVEENTWKTYGHLLKESTPHLYGYCSTSFIYTDLHSVFRAGQQAFELPAALKNRKGHDLENLLAAYALCADREIQARAFLEAWYTFKKPAHRIEFVAEYQGIKFYDDSKGTNLDAVIRAVQSLEGSIILIAGGVDKGAAYTPWLDEFKNKVKSICAIGQAAAKIEAQLSSHLPVTIFQTLEEAVQQAAREAQRGEIVLLSPGCASVDMFRDYAHRGEEFQRIVRELGAKVGQ